MLNPNSKLLLLSLHSNRLGNSVVLDDEVVGKVSSVRYVNSVPVSEVDVVDPVSVPRLVDSLVGGVVRLVDSESEVVVEKARLLTTVEVLDVLGVEVGSDVKVVLVETVNANRVGGRLSNVVVKPKGSCV